MSNNNPSPATAHFKWHNKPQEPVEKEPAEKESRFGFLSQGQTAATSASLDAENRRKYPQTILYPTDTGKTPDDYAVIPRKERTNTPSPAASQTAKETTQQGSLQTTQRGSSKGSSETAKAGSWEDDVWKLFDQWKAAVIGGMKPSSEPFNEFVFARMELKGIGKDKLKPVWDAFGEHGVKDGFLIIGENYKPGSTSPKFKLNPAYKKAA